ncbi:unnamed protein product [Linum trigynum]|uniref:Uncharacterized protein n=1 Tax=Linum trigynum TaxID=586398 RepID=A0AAV2F7I5_9ROSI
MPSQGETAKLNPKQHESHAGQQVRYRQLAWQNIDQISAKRPRLIVKNPLPGFGMEGNLRPGRPSPNYPVVAIVSFSRKVQVQSSMVLRSEGE